MSYIELANGNFDNLEEVIEFIDGTMRPALYDERYRTMVQPYLVGMLGGHENISLEYVLNLMGALLSEAMLEEGDRDNFIAIYEQIYQGFKDKIGDDGSELLDGVFNHHRSNLESQDVATYQSTASLGATTDYWENLSPEERSQDFADLSAVSQTILINSFADYVRGLTPEERMGIYGTVAEYPPNLFQTYLNNLTIDNDLTLIGTVFDEINEDRQQTLISQLNSDQYMMLALNLDDDLRERYGIVSNDEVWERLPELYSRLGGPQLADEGLEMIRSWNNAGGDTNLEHLREAIDTIPEEFMEQPLEAKMLYDNVYRLAVNYQEKIARLEEVVWDYMASDEYLSDAMAPDPMVQALFEIGASIAFEPVDWILTGRDLFQDYQDDGRIGAANIAAAGLTLLPIIPNLNRIGDIVRMTDTYFYGWRHGDNVAGAVNRVDGVGVGDGTTLSLSEAFSGRSPSSTNSSHSDEIFETNEASQEWFDNLVASDYPHLNHLIVHLKGVLIRNAELGIESLARVAQDYPETLDRQAGIFANSNLLEVASQQTWFDASGSHWVNLNIGGGGGNMWARSMDGLYHPGKIIAHEEAHNLLSWIILNDTHSQSVQYLSNMRQIDEWSRLTEGQSLRNQSNQFFYPTQQLLTDNVLIRNSGDFFTQISSFPSVPEWMQQLCPKV